MLEKYHNIKNNIPNVHLDKDTSMVKNVKDVNFLNIGTSIKYNAEIVTKICISINMLVNVYIKTALNYSRQISMQIKEFIIMANSTMLRMN